MAAITERIAMATVCRCCLAAGAACKALTGAYDWMGECEVYADMLLDSFDIKIAEKPGDGICDVCVGRLRDAVGFKRQVLRSQRLYQQLESDRVEPKEEVVTSEDGDAGGSDMDDDDDKDMLPLSTYAREPKVIFNAKNKATHGQPSNCTAEEKLRTKSAVRSRKKTNMDLVKKGLKTIVGSTSIKPLGEKTSSDDDTTTEEDETIKQTSSKIVNGGTFATPSLEQLNAMPERVKINVNTSAVVKFSNVTPFKSKVHDGYICFYCGRVFPDPSDLRGHTAAEHDTDKLNFFQRLKGMGKQDVKLDITALRCTICSQAISDLNALKDHLVAAHDKKLFRDLSENTLPFKLTKEGPLHCALCSQPFETYRTLHLHMNTHFRNHVCAQCGAGFVTQRRLRFHESRHRAGAYRCEACGKTYQSRVKLNSHRRGVHEGLWKRNKCPHCPERFTDYYKKQQHLVEAHNEPKIEYRCGACSKEFTNKTRLTNHTKKYHLQEVHFECSVCAQKFFARRELRRHMARHAASPTALPCNRNALACEVCHRTLSTKASLKEHMLTHGRTFKSAVILKNDVDPPHPTDIALE